MFRVGERDRLLVNDDYDDEAERDCFGRPIGLQEPLDRRRQLVKNWALKFARIPLAYWLLPIVIVAFWILLLYRRFDGARVATGWADDASWAGTFNVQDPGGSDGYPWIAEQGGNGVGLNMTFCPPQSTELFWYSTQHLAAGLGTLLSTLYAAAQGYLFFRRNRGHLRERINIRALAATAGLAAVFGGYWGIVARMPGVIQELHDQVLAETAISASLINQVLSQAGFRGEHLSRVSDLMRRLIIRFTPEDMVSLSTLFSRCEYNISTVTAAVFDSESSVGSGARDDRGGGIVPPGLQEAFVDMIAADRLNSLYGNTLLIALSALSLYCGVLMYFGKKPSAGVGASPLAPPVMMSAIPFDMPHSLARVFNTVITERVPVTADTLTIHSAGISSGGPLTSVHSSDDEDGTDILSREGVGDQREREVGRILEELERPAGMGGAGAVAAGDASLTALAYAALAAKVEMMVDWPNTHDERDNFRDALNALAQVEFSATRAGGGASSAPANLQEAKRSMGRTFLALHDAMTFEQRAQLLSTGPGGVHDSALMTMRV